jgi:hypothetical protein
MDVAGGLRRGRPRVAGGGRSRRAEPATRARLVGSPLRGEGAAKSAERRVREPGPRPRPEGRALEDGM